MLILHYTGMVTAQAALERLCDPAAEVSAHYLIDEDGTVWQLVDESRRAWHAGRAFWAGETDINGRSIGIELANPGHRPFPEPQIAALEELSRAILARHAIPPERVLGHSDVAPLRKEDPGELFPWQRLAAAGIGLWPDFTTPEALPEPSISRARRNLAGIGYEIGAPASAENGSLSDGVLDTAVVVAFQRHYRATCCDGALDAETAHRIARLAAVLSA